MTDSFGRGFPQGSQCQRPIVPIYSPLPGAILEVVLLDSLVLHREMHFDRNIGPFGAPVPCMGLPSCSYCCANLGKRPRCFLACALLGTLKPGVLQLSDGGAEDLRLIVQRLADWRGLTLSITRRDKRRNARQVVASKGRFDGERLPPTFNVIPVLERIWGMVNGAPTRTQERQPRTPQSRERKER